MEQVAKAWARLAWVRELSTIQHSTPTLQAWLSCWKPSHFHQGLLTHDLSEGSNLSLFKLSMFTETFTTRGMKFVKWWKWKSKLLSRVWLCDPMNCSLAGSSVHGILQVKILEWVAITPLQGIYVTQGLNLGLPYCRQFLYHLSQQDTWSLILYFHIQLFLPDTLLLCT